MTTAPRLPIVFPRCPKCSMPYQNEAFLWRLDGETYCAACVPLKRMISRAAEEK